MPEKAKQANLLLDSNIPALCRLGNAHHNWRDIMAPAQTGISSTGNCGINLTFANGYSASVKFGTLHSCEQRNPKVDAGFPARGYEWRSANAEIAAWDNSENYIRFKSGSDVRGYVEPDVVADFLNIVSTIPAELDGTQLMFDDSYGNPMSLVERKDKERKPAKIDLPAEIVYLIGKGQIIDAVKAHRRIYGSSLYDAKKAIDAYREGEPEWKQEYKPGLGEPVMPHEVKLLVQRGLIIEAIKEYRKHYATDLKEAKNAVDKYREFIRVGGKKESPKKPDIQKKYRPKLDQFLENGQFIAAIKYVRECTWLGLKEAKDLVEQYQDYYFPDWREKNKGYRSW
jgi:ribosomal protein L7/L12